MDQGFMLTTEFNDDPDVAKKISAFLDKWQKDIGEVFPGVDKKSSLHHKLKQM